MCLLIHLNTCEKMFFWPEHADMVTCFHMGKEMCRIPSTFAHLIRQFLYLSEFTLSDCFLQVIINFPDPAHKSDIVQLRGPKNEVEKCTKYMQKMVADLVRETSMCYSLFHAWITLE